MSSEKNTEEEMLIQKGYKLKIPQLMHQPVVIAVDVNNSMNTMEAGQQKTNLKLIQDVINQIGQDSELKEEDKKTIDLCVMHFQMMMVWKVGSPYQSIMVELHGIRQSFMMW